MSLAWSSISIYHLLLGFLRASLRVPVWHFSFALSAVCSLNETNTSTWAVSCPPPGFRTILRAFLWEFYSFLLRHEHRPKAEGMGHWVTAWVTLKFTFLGKGVIQYDHLELLKSKCFLYSNQASKFDSNTCPDFVHIYHLCFRSNLASYQSYFFKVDDYTSSYFQLLFSSYGQT